ncbi:sensor histidine kinase [Nonomuraea longispora]|uniref:sensor histidine kinase n=1 Tax=Nonomuraea longispora TaxID=1848320 RepID=UPI00140551C3|nr:histidine kinase [Nonomuraea longispora]
MAWAVTATVAVGYATNSLITVVAGGLRGAGLLAFLCCLGVVVSLQLAHYSQGALSWPGRVRFVTLLVQGLATFAPAAWVGPQFGAAAGFLAGSMLLVIRGGARWVLYLAVGAAVLVAALLQGQPWEPLNLVYAVHFTLLTGLMLYAVGSLSTIAAELRDSRSDLVRMAVVQERLRVARDLHDLVGHDLSAITLRYELAYRLLPAAPARASEEMRHVLDVVRQATVGAQFVTGGYGRMSLAEEKTDAAATLSAAQIEAGIRIPDVTLAGRLDEVMAVVLREGITNVLRHSKAQQCQIELVVEGDTVRFQVANDGADAVPDDLTARGDGLGNLTARLAEVGGRLTTRSEGDWFYLTAEAPARHQAGSSDRHSTDGFSPTGWTREAGVAQRWGPKMASGIVVVVLAGYAVTMLLNIVWMYSGAAGALGAAACVAIMLVMQLLLTFGLLRKPWMRWAALLVEAAAAFLPLAWLHAPWGGMGGFVAAAVLLVVTGMVRWVLYAALGGAVLTLAVLTGTSVSMGAWLTISTLLTGLVVYGVSWLVTMVAETHAARSELAHAAVERERLRMARQLNDVLVDGLSQVALKGVLACRLLGTTPSRAHTELERILELLRRMLSDVRHVASDYRNISFIGEVDSARAILAAAGIEVTVDLRLGTLDKKTDAVLATVLREAVTNILRHSTARRCVIEGEDGRLTIRNDGVELPPGPRPVHSQHGVGDLARRLDGVGGRLEALVEDGWFKVTALL